MARLVLWYAHAAPGWPVESLGGLALVTRTLLTAQAAGITSASVALHAADQAAVEALLGADPRITLRWTLHADPQSATGLVGGDPEVIFVLGDRLVLAEAFEQLMGALPDGLDARPLCAERAAPSGMARLRSATARALGPAALSDQLRDLPGGARAQALVVDRGWAPLQRRDQWPAAERLLLKSYTCSHDGPVTRYLTRPLSTRILQSSVEQGVLPAVLLLFGSALSVTASAASAMGSYASMAIGGLLFYLTAVMTKAVDDLARLQQRTAGSPWPSAPAEAATLLYMFGLYAGLRTQAPGFPGWIGWGALGVFAVTVVLQRVGPALSTGSGWLEGMKRTVFRFDFYALAAAALSIGGVPAIFGGAFAIGAVVACVVCIIDLLRARGDTSG